MAYMIYIYTTPSILYIYTLRRTSSRDRCVRRVRAGHAPRRGPRTARAALRDVRRRRRVGLRGRGSRS